MANGNGNSVAGLLQRLLGGPGPTLGCEISSSGVMVARWNAGASQLSTSAWRPLPEGAVEPTPLRENFVRPDVVRDALADCLRSLGLDSSGVTARQHGRDSVLVMPDQSARLFVLDFETLPRGKSEALELVRWKLKKSVPFDIDSSAISFTAHRRAGGWQVIAVVTPLAIVQQYEQLLASKGLSVSRVTLSSLAALALLPDSNSGGTLMVKMDAPWITTAIVDAGDLALFRTAALGSVDAVTQALILETIYPAFAYFQDTFSRPLDRAYVCGLGEFTLPVMEAISTELHVPTVLLMSGNEAATSSPANWSRNDAERHSAALVGLLRE